MNTIFFNRVNTAASSSKPTIEVLVFKTNLTDSRRIGDVEPLLEVHPNIIEWNVDLEDCDNVLRIVGRNMAAGEVEDILLNAGYCCEELQ